MLDSVEKGQASQAAEKRWHISQYSSRILVEVATAYAITKVFLPVRILCSVWATPWFARVVVGRVGGGVGRWFGGAGRGVSSGLRNAAEKGGGVVGKNGNPIKNPSTKS